MQSCRQKVINYALAAWPNIELISCNGCTLNNTVSLSASRETPTPPQSHKKMHLNGFNNQFLGISLILELHFNCCHWYMTSHCMQPFDVIFRLPWRRARVCLCVPLALESDRPEAAVHWKFICFLAQQQYADIHVDNLLQRWKINIVERRLISHSCTRPIVCCEAIESGRGTLRYKWKHHRFFKAS